jgi:peroxin-7
MEYTMTGYSGCAVKFSTYRNDKLAVAAAKNFGLVGNGAVFVLGLGPNGIEAERV